MAFDVTVHHPLYGQYIGSWTLLRDAFGGEDEIKAKGTVYLPMKPGQAAIDDERSRSKAYSFYKTYAEFPDLVALTTRGAVGTVLDKPATIDLPSELEPLREKATRDGLTLEALHRRIVTELMLTGRYGVLPGIAQDGAAYLAGYVAEAIINWDETEQAADYVVLDESAKVRNRETGAWEDVERYRECLVQDGRYGARVWTQTDAGMEVGDVVEAANRRQQPIGFLPFVFINTADLTPAPDDVPLFGLAKISLRIYRMDANYQFGLYMTSEPTPWVAGQFDDGDDMRSPPSTIGASKLWVLPDGASAGMLEFTGAGLSAQQKAIEDAKADAVMFGAQILTERNTGQESGEAKRVRLDSQHSTLKGIAMTSAAGLERALKNIALWVGANPDQVKVEPNLDFFDHDMTAQDITALVAGWQSGAFSRRTLHWNFQRGGVVPEGKTYDAEQEEIDSEGGGMPPPAPEDA